MVFQVAVIYYSAQGMLVTLANVIAEGAKKVSMRALMCSSVRQRRMRGQHAGFRPQLTSQCMCAQVPGAEVTVYRVQDPVKGDDHSLYDEGVLDAPVVTHEVDTQ